MTEKKENYHAEVIQTRFLLKTFGQPSLNISVITTVLAERLIIIKFKSYFWFQFGELSMYLNRFNLFSNSSLNYENIIFFVLCKQGSNVLVIL